MDYKEDGMTEQAVVETQVAVAEAGTEVSAETTATPEVEKADEVDWKAQAETQKAENAKLEKLIEDSRGREIGLLKQAERDALAKRTADKVEALAAAMESQDWDGYRAKVQEIDTQASKAQSAAATEEEREAAKAELFEIDERLGGNLESHALFENVRLYWRQGLSTENPYYFQRAVAEAHKAEARLAREELDKTRRDNDKAMKAAIAEAEKRAKEESGLYDVGAGAEIGGAGSPSLASLVTKDIRRMTPNERNQYRKDLDAAMKRGR